MPGFRILLASGDPELAECIRRLLAQMGDQMAGAVSSAEEAIETAATDPPDLVLFDIGLDAEGTGPGEAARIQAALDIPVVYLASQEQGQSCVDALKESHYGFLLRPITRLALEATIEMSRRRHALDLQLKERESELRTLVENIPGAVYRCELDPPWRMQQMSDGVLALTGRHKSDFLDRGVTWKDITYPADLQYVASEVAAAIEQQRAYHITYRILDDGGDIRWVEECGRCIDGCGGSDRHLDGVLLDVTERRQAEQAKASAHAELQAIYASVPVALMLVDRDRRVQKANRAAAAVAGRPASGMAGRRAGEALRCLNALEDERGCGYGPLCQACPIRSAVQQTFEDGLQREGIEAWMRIGEGESAESTCMLVTTTLLDYDGEPKVLVSAQDITEKKRSETELEAERAELRAVYDHAPTMMSVLDRTGEVLYKNQAFAAFAGQPSAPRRAEGAATSECCERILRSLGLCRDEQDCLSCTLCDAIRSTLNTGIEHIDVEFRTVLNKAGERREVVLLCSTAMIRTGGKDRLLLCMTDVTERLLAEEALLQSERRFAQVAEFTREMIWETDPSGRYTYVSGACYQMLGYRPDEIVGKMRYYDLHPTEGREAFIAATQAAILRKESFVGFHNAVQAKDGRVLEVSTNAAPVVGEGGRLLCYRGADRDITEEKRTEARLAQAQKMESVGRLAGGVAHDFNNLLTVINGYGQLVLDKLPASDPNLPHVREILKAGERAASLTRQLLAFSRKQVLEPKVINLNAIIAELCPMIERLAGESITIVTELDPSIEPVLADQHQMEQVVMNLALNARDAMPLGGTLLLKIFPAADHATNRPGANPPGRYTVLTVSDNGAGMDADTRQRAFEPFFTTKETGRGTGLGLSIVHGIIEQSNGFIEIESEPGKGTTFSIYLPVTHLPPTKASQPLPGKHTKGQGTILVVEDKPEVRAFAVEVLTSSGYHVLSAGGSGEALLLAGQTPGSIDLLLTDVVMPVIDGKVLAARLRQARPGLRVLFMSGYTPDTAADVEAPDDTSAFIEKPFGPAQLLEKIQSVLSQGPVL